ncbi:hypothetical protein UA3_02595 [Enterococcus faecium EnGen0263]|nr:hypothetical protein UA3_02595 [Enterococcus faecium EnGen0263]
MIILRDIFRFSVLHYEFFAILLLAIATISLSIKVTKQQENINELERKISEIQIYKNTDTDRNK